MILTLKVEFTDTNDLSNYSRGRFEWQPTVTHDTREAFTPEQHQALLEWLARDDDFGGYMTDCVYSAIQKIVLSNTKD